MQEVREPLYYEEMTDLIKYMMKLRYRIEKLIEDYTRYEKAYIDNVTQIKKNESIAQSMLKFNGNSKISLMAKRSKTRLHNKNNDELEIDEETHLFIQEYLKKFLKEKNQSSQVEIIRAKSMYYNH